MSKITHPITHLLTPTDLKLKQYVEKKAVNGKSLKKMQDILNKTHVSLTQLVLEERAYQQ